MAQQKDFGPRSRSKEERDEKEKNLRCVTREKSAPPEGRPGLGGEKAQNGRKSMFFKKAPGEKGRALFILSGAAGPKSV